MIVIARKGTSTYENLNRYLPNNFVKEMPRQSFNLVGKFEG